MRYPQLADRGWLDAQYSETQRTAENIAAEVGCSTAAVHWRLHHFGIPILDRAERPRQWRPKPCRRCKQAFQPEAPSHLFCSEECRLDLRPCLQCAIKVPASKRYGYDHRFCSRTCRQLWRLEQGKRRAGSTYRWRTRDGYIMVPHPQEPKRRILEHRLVMEQVLGRRLEPYETVHHINGQHDDNRPDNLQLRRGRHGKGVVLRCLDCGSSNVEPVPISEAE